MNNSSNERTYQKNELEQNPYSTLNEWFTLTPHETIKTLVSRVVEGFNSNVEIKITISDDENYEMPENIKTAQQITLSSNNIEDFFEYHDLTIKKQKFSDYESSQYSIALDQLILRSWILHDCHTKLIDDNNGIGISKSLPIYLTLYGMRAIWKIRDRILIDEQNNQKFNELDLIRNYFCKVLNELNAKLDTEDESLNQFIQTIESDKSNYLTLKQYLFQGILEATCVVTENKIQQYNPKDLAEIIILLNPDILQENKEFFKNIIGVNTTSVAYAIYEKYNYVTQNGIITLPGSKSSDDDTATIIKQNYNNYVKNVLGNPLLDKSIDQDILEQFEADDHKLIAEEFAKLRRHKLNQDNDVRRLIESCSFEIMHQIVKACKYENSLEGFWGAFEAFFRWLQVCFERDSTRREQINILLQKLLDQAIEPDELIFGDNGEQNNSKQLSPEIKLSEKGKEKEDDIEPKVNGSTKVAEEYFNNAVAQHISRNQDSRQK